MSTRIPDHLLDPRERQPFLQWLCQMPMTLPVKRRLAREWQDHCLTRLEPIELLAIANSRIPRNG